MGGPLVMVGFDGMSWPLVEQWAAAGHLPTMAGMIAAGTCGLLPSPEGTNDSAAWTSFATGLLPERHGWVYPRAIQPGGYAVERVTRDVVEGPPFWQAVSDAGRAVTVLDVPKSPRARDLRGVELVDWLTHGADSAGPSSLPPALAERVIADGWSHPGECLQYGLDGEGLSTWLDGRRDMTRRTGDLLVDQLGARPAALFIGVFGAPHCVGHQCWHVHDPRHPHHDPSVAAELGDPLLACYVDIDRQLASVLDAVPVDATVIGFACLGMGANSSGDGAIERLLRRLDPATAPTAVAAREATGRAWRRFVPRRVRRALPRSWHSAVQSREQAARPRRSWFAVETGTRSSGIRINLAGREAAGRIQPGTEYEAAIAELTGALRELVDDDTGAPVVAEVERTSERHDGPWAGALPDLLVHWTRAPGPPRAIRSPRVGIVPANPPDRTGHHDPEGFWVATGPGVAAGRVAADARVVDLGVTAASLLGVGLDDVDGRLIPELAGAGT